MNPDRVERKKKLQKYMNLLKPKRRSEDLSYTLKQQEQPINNKKKQLLKEIKRLEEDNQPIWQDPDDHTRINLEDKNISKKFIRGETMITQSEYSKRNKEFYASKQEQQFTSWAVEGEAGLENEEGNVFEEEFETFATKQTTLEFYKKTDYKHGSVVSDICWSNNALFTIGLDKVLSVYGIKRDSLQEIQNRGSKHFFRNLPLTKCVEANNKIYIGTLRKNYIVYDYNQGEEQLYSSTFLGEHKTYANLRANEKMLSIFSNKLISLFSLNNQFITQLQTNESITDLCIDQNDIIATTKNSIYRWDNRTNRILEVVHTGLNNTSASIVRQNDTLLVGTFSGVIYSHRLNPSVKETIKQIPNLTTSISGIVHDKTGNLVVAYSKWKKNALRVIEVPRQAVLQSWPSITTKLNFATAASFSNCGKYLSTGSANGNVNIYKIAN